MCVHAVESPYSPCPTWTVVNDSNGCRAKKRPCCQAAPAMPCPIALAQHRALREAPTPKRTLAKLARGTARRKSCQGCSRSCHRRIRILLAEQHPFPSALADRVAPVAFLWGAPARCAGRPCLPTAGRGVAYTQSVLLCSWGYLSLS